MPRKSSRAPRPRRTIPPGAVIDGMPTRAVTSLNVRRHEKAMFDVMHAHWRLQTGLALSHWDSFSILLRLAILDPRADLPAELRPREEEPP